MTTGATGQLGLALPVQGELSGTWGDTVNNGITQYTNIAIAATLTLTNDGAVTLANTTGDATASNITSSLTGAGTVTAQFAIVRVTGTLTTAKVITAPSYSKTYVVVNAATGGIVTFKASGQTGVSIAVGESAWVYYNGTDYVKIAGTAAGAAGGSNTQVQYNSSGALAGSSNLTFDGTSLTLGGNPTLSAGTANGVTYLNGSKVLTSGSALTFDGTNFIVGGGGGLSRFNVSNNGSGGFEINPDGTASGPTLVAYNRGSSAFLQMTRQALNHVWQISTTEGMRLTSTGLGIGTSSPTQSLDVNGNAIFRLASATTSRTLGFTTSNGVDGWTIGNGVTASANQFVIYSNTAGAARLLIDSSGNVGIGTSSPSTKLDVSGNAKSNGYTFNYNTSYWNADGYLSNYSATNGVYLNGNASGWLHLNADGTQATRIKLYGSSNATPNIIEFTTASSERARISAAGGFSVGTTADPGAGAIYATGNITAYYSSDIKFKENVRDIPDALATVNAIGGKLFDWTDEYIESKGGADGYFVQKADFGVVAQDVQKVFPIAVRTREDGSLAVDYEKLGALAMAALTELTKRVEALEAK